MAHGPSRWHQQHSSNPSISPQRRHTPKDNDRLAMYNTNQQSHFMNGAGNGHQRYAISANKNGTHQTGVHRQQQEYSQNNYANHQHNSSNPAFPSTSSHFNVNNLRNDSPQLRIAQGRNSDSDWVNKQTQLQEDALVHAKTHHFHAKTSNQTKAASSIEQTDNDREERNRITQGNSPDQNNQQWDALDMGGQGLCALSKQLFSYTFLKKLYLCGNDLRFLPGDIGKMRCLNYLDLTKNHLQQIPPEIGMLVNLKSLLLFDNDIAELPFEMGSLHQLQDLGLQGNPLSQNHMNDLLEGGTKQLIGNLREEMAHAHHEENVGELREMYVVDETIDTSPSNHDTFRIVTYNTLCDRAATQSHYGYLSQILLDWSYRRHLILDELTRSDADILCLQEIDVESYHEYFRPELAHHDYKGVYWPKPRARTMAENEAKSVDGCATFYRNSKYVLLDKKVIDISNTAINRPDMRGEHDVFNRVMPKDNIAVVTFLEDRITGARLIVCNAHMYWDPAFKDVKVVQIAIILEQLAKIAEAYSKHPPCKDKALYRFADRDDEESATTGEEKAKTPEPGPSLEYASGTQIPLILCGDFNSLPDSGVYDLLATGSLPATHSDLMSYQYGEFTRTGMTHPFALKSAYGNMGEMSFTNYTPGFTGVVDYIWYSTGSLGVIDLLGDISPEYLKRIPGFPSAHFPSDHVRLLSSFSVKPQRKERKVVEADFGPGNRSRDKTDEGSKDRGTQHRK